MPNTTVNRFKKYRKTQLDLIKDTPTRNTIDALQNRIAIIEGLLEQFSYAESEDFEYSFSTATDATRSTRVQNGSVSVKSNGSPILVVTHPTRFTYISDGNENNIQWRCNSAIHAEGLYWTLNANVTRNGGSTPVYAFRKDFHGPAGSSGTLGTFRFEQFQFCFVDFEPVVGNNTYELNIDIETVPLLVNGSIKSRMRAIPLPFLKRQT
jgi:hypothetical protein